MKICRDWGPRGPSQDTAGTLTQFSWQRDGKVLFLVHFTDEEIEAQRGDWNVAAAMPAWAMWFCMCGQSRAGFLLGTAPVGGRLAWPGEVPAAWQRLPTESPAPGPAPWGLLRKWTVATVHSPWGGQVPGQLLTLMWGRVPVSLQLPLFLEPPAP